LVAKVAAVRDATRTLFDAAVSRANAALEDAAPHLTHLIDLSVAKAEQELDEDADATRFEQNAPDGAMITVLVVAVVIFLMPTILGRVEQAQPDNISGPLGSINSGEQAAGIIQFAWLVPLLIIVFVVLAYLRSAQ
jgi:hypothetical protein